MAEKRRSRTASMDSYRRGSRMQSTYIEGNTARKLDVYAEPVSDIDYKQQRVREVRLLRNRARERQMSLGFVVFLAAASVALTLICGQYLQVRAEVTTASGRAEALESELRALRTANDYRQNALESATDINYVYDVAVNQLGMVYPGEDQVITYQSSPSEYVIQSDSLG